MLCTFSMGPPFLFRAVLIYELSIDFFKKPVRFQSSLMKMSQAQKRLCESMSLNIREAFNRRQTSNKLMFMGEGRAFNHGCHNKSKEVMPFPTRFQHLCVFSIKSKRVEPIFTALQNITENWLSSKNESSKGGNWLPLSNASVGPTSRIILDYLWLEFSTGL